MHWVCYTEIQGLYAAAARQAGLAPADRPVVVLREGRVYDGCREAFAAGLVVGALERQARRDAPRAVITDLALLDAAPAAACWWEECLAHTPYIEPLAPHQLYLALPTPGQALTAPLRAEATALQQAAAAHGFVAFTGVAPSKVVARAAALACREGWLLRRPGQARAGPGAAPPATLQFVRPGEEAGFLAPLPLHLLPSPPEVQRRLARLGLHSIGEAARIPEGEWLRQLGPLGRQLALWSRGVDRDPVKAVYPFRQLQRRRQFAPELRDRDQLERVIAQLAAALARELNQAGEGCQQVSLLLEQAEGPPLQQVRILTRLQQAAWPLQQALQLLLGQAAAAGPVVSAVTVSVGLIAPMPWRQLDLWEDAGRSEREERLQQALALLYERFPVRVVGLGPRQSTSWREQMLQFADPYRWGRKGAGAG